MKYVSGSGTILPLTYFIHLPMKMEPIVSSETSVIRTQTQGNYPKRNKLQRKVVLPICSLSVAYVTRPVAKIASFLSILSVEIRHTFHSLYVTNNFIIKHQTGM